MGLSLAGPSGVGLGLPALRWLAFVDPVPDASGFPCRPSFWCASHLPLAAFSSCFAGPPPGCGCPFLGPLFALPPTLFFFCFLFVVVFRFPPLFLAFFRFWPRLPRALTLCVVFFVGSSCALASFVCLARPLAALWWLLPAPPLLRLLVFVAAARCLAFFFLFLLLSAPPFPLAFSGFRPRVRWALALCFLFFFSSRLSALRAL